MQGKAETIKDFMVPFTDYPRLNHNATLQDAIEIMYTMSREKGYRWIVVLDDNNKIAGFLTLRTVFESIHKLGSEAGNKLNIFGYAPHDTFFWEGIQSIKDTPLKKCLRPLVDVSIKDDEYPAKAAEVIIKRKITIVPVVNDQNEVVGIIRPVDLLPFIKNLFDNAPG